MNHANPLPIVLIAGFFFSFAPGAMGQCTDVPTTPEIGVYSTYRFDYDYRYAPDISSSNKVTYEFTILQWWGCCTLSENCNIVITTAYGTQPVKVWQDPENGVDADFEFSAKGKYIVSASHHGFSNCAGGTNVRLLNFFLTDDLNDLDADGILNGVDANTDGDILNNDVDPDDDNDDLLDGMDSTPGGYGTTPSAWPSNWGGSGPPAGGTPTIPIPTPTMTPTPTLIPMCLVAKMHCPGQPSSGDISNAAGSYGHGMVKLYTNNISALPTQIQPAASLYNNKYIGKYPINDGIWLYILSDSRIAIDDTFGDNPIAKEYSVSSEANYAAAMTYIADEIDSPGYYTWHSSNCVDFTESVASEADVSLPASTSWWSGYWVSFPGIMGYNIYISGGGF